MKLKIYFDEAGRGPLAWPVVIWCLVPLNTFDNSFFADSKKLSEKKRELSYSKIEELEKTNKLAFSFWFATNSEIDNFWISKSINIATKRALVIIIMKLLDYFEKNIWFEWDKLLNITKLRKLIYPIFEDIENIEKYDLKEIIKILSEIEKLHWLIFDGNNDFSLSKDLWFKIITIIKWDDKVPFIWWASIVAKVVRDRYMKEIAEKYPKYKFEKHKWYWTKLHRENIKIYWPCNIHRISFLKNIINNNLFN